MEFLYLFPGVILKDKHSLNGRKIDNHIIKSFLLHIHNPLSIRHRCVNKVPTFQNNEQSLTDKSVEIPIIQISNSNDN